MCLQGSESYQPRLGGGHIASLTLFSALRLLLPVCPPGQGPVQVWVELPRSPPLKTYLMLSCSSSRLTHFWIPLCHLPPTSLSSLSPAGNQR